MGKFKTAKDAIMFLTVEAFGIIETFCRCHGDRFHFMEAVKKLVAENGKVFITLHTFTQDLQKTSVRLWLKKPERSNLGHPDWDWQTAVFEIIENNNIVSVGEILTQDVIEDIKKGGCIRMESIQILRSSSKLALSPEMQIYEIVFSK